jgi:hypothetical protein
MRLALSSPRTIAVCVCPPGLFVDECCRILVRFPTRFYDLANVNAVRYFGRLGHRVGD